LIDGGEGADIIRGEAGFDRMTGGGGADVFAFLKASDAGKARNKRDVITDFVSGEDLVDISLMDANTTIRDIQDFVLLHTANERFTAAGQLRIRYESDATGQRTIIEGNIDRTLVADFQIELTGTHALTAADFIL